MVCWYQVLKVEVVFIKSSESQELWRKYEKQRNRERTCIDAKLLRKVIVITTKEKAIVSF